MKLLHRPRAVLRQFLLLFLPVSALVGGLLAATYYGEVKVGRRELEAKEVRSLTLKEKIVTSEFEAIVSDLMIMTAQNELQEMLAGDSDRQKALAEEYLSLAKRRKHYDQIRFLDMRGMEIVRVNFNAGQPTIVREAERQSKSDRDFFIKTSLLKEGEVFVSPFDLNIEQGKIERPLKPTIRFATPVFDRRGQKRGIIVLNYLGTKLLSQLKASSVASRGNFMLLNADGFWIESPDPAAEWGFMLPERADRTFGNAFPSAWQQILATESGQVQTTEGFFTFTTVYPILESHLYPAFGQRSPFIDPDSYQWKLVSHLSPTALRAITYQSLQDWLWLYGILLLLIGLGTGGLTFVRARQQLTEAELTQSEARLQDLARREAVLQSRLASQIRDSLELDTILETAMMEIRDLLQIDRCLFGWYRFQADPPVWEVVQEARHPGVKSALGSYSAEVVGLLADNLLNLTVLQIDDVTLTQPLLQQWLRSLECTSLLALPIRTRSGAMGVTLCAHCSGPRPWGKAEVELLEGIMGQLAIALNQAELYAESRDNALKAQTQAQQLEQTLQELKNTQAQLIQTEKMSSLGQLVAGVAHEINNPVNFIYGNITHANGYTQDILQLVDLYQQHYPQPDPTIQEHIELVELDFLKEDLPQLLASMKLGTDRIREIVLSLRNFSRLDEAEMKPADIHEGIDSTLLILQNRLKAQSHRPEIKVVKDYGDLPDIVCNPGQLNQVFMNLIVNAIDALESYVRLKDDPSDKLAQSSHSSNGQMSGDMKPTLWISTEPVDARQIAIHIADNGPGMDEAVRQRLFDPFFTTKPVGRGTGLGLSISYQIVTEKHQGKIRCDSAPGEGAKFTIEIPMQQQ